MRMTTTPMGMYDQFEPSRIDSSHKGLPQGSPTSPLLSTFMLKNLFSKYEMIMYADDGLIFNTERINLSDDYIGIEENKEKGG